MSFLARAATTAAVALTLLASIATCSVNIALPQVEPHAAGRRSLLADLAGAVREAAWPADGGSVATDPERLQMEASPAVLGSALANQSLVVTSVSSTVLRLAADPAGGGLAVSQPLAPLDACLVWRRRASTAGAAAAGRDGMYFLNVFHSSVWSVLLLCLLCVVGCLAVLEAVHPIGMPKQLAATLARRPGRGGSGKPMGAFHALAFATGALLLLGHPRAPKGASSRVLALFWWLFAFSVAVAYLSASLLVFLTTHSQPDAVASDAGVSEVLNSQQQVLCSVGNSLCADWARPEPLLRTNFTSVDSDSAGLQQLLHGSAGLSLLTHQFACANLLAADASNRTYSVAIVARAAAWVSLAGPANLTQQADGHIVSLLAAGQLSRLARQHGMEAVEVYDSSSGGNGGATNDFLAELRLGLPYRVGSFYGPLVLLLVGFGLCLCSAVCEFCYYRFFFEVDEVELKEAEMLEQKERALSVAASGTLETYL